MELVYLGCQRQKKRNHLRCLYDRLNLSHYSTVEQLLSVFCLVDPCGILLVHIALVRFYY